MQLAHKKILLAITGSIAAYKAAFLCRLLIKQGAEVRVIMTPASQDFISSLTLSTLSKNKVHSSVSDGEAWNNHVEIGLWADAMIIAPATANTLAKMANGMADNIVLACYLSAKCPVFFAPAMDLDMWKHPSAINNIAKLESYGNILIPVGTGELASGLVGDGRMAEPEAIIDQLSTYFDAEKSLLGKKFIVTAGPTREALDPVRFIGNRSTGKMGIEIAACLANMGAKVSLILGPTHLSISHINIRTINVVSANEMYKACIAEYNDANGAIMAAAVADYKPKEISDTKIKKKSDDMSIALERTQDIAAALGKIKTKDQINVGFALETNNEESNALGKLQRKNFDFIVLNSLNDKGAGFGGNTNKVNIYTKEGKKHSYPLKSKKEVAEDICQLIFSYFKSK